MYQLFFFRNKKAVPKDNAIIAIGNAAPLSPVFGLLLAEEVDTLLVVVVVDVDVVVVTSFDADDVVTTFF